MGEVHTICAPATGVAVSGIGIIRISGPRALQALRDVGYDGNVKHRLATVFTFRGKSGDVIDNGLFIFFNSPHSFTGEDVLELHLHGSIAVMQDAMAELLSLDYLKMAEPGEFTKRALWNGKLDLVQVEGLSELLSAKTSIQRIVAMRSYKGEFSKFYDSWRSNIIAILAKLEVLIDFPDEYIPKDVVDKAIADMRNLEHEIRAYLANAKDVNVITGGLNVVIFGPPNSGKSTLINAISNQDLAIVSDIPGTTRDIINATLNIGGFMVNITDTAGLRKETSDIIENMGIERSIERLRMADIQLLTLDASAPDDIPSFLEPYADFIQSNAIVICNKMDVMRQGDRERIIQILSKCSIDESNIVYVSAKNMVGLDEIIDKIKKYTVDLQEAVYDESPIFIRMRYKELLAAAANHLAMASFAHSLDIACEHIRCAADNIGYITGVIDIEEVLDNIFSNFCIGK